MHFEVLGHRRNHKCSIELLKANVIEIKRRPNQVFHFKDVNNFINTLIGHNSCVVHFGKDSPDDETWKAYFWEPTFDHARSASYTASGENLLPPGSLAILETETEYELEFELERQAKITRQWIDLFNEISSLAGKIRRVDPENKYGDPERFEYMNVEELATVLEETKTEYQRLTRREKAEV